MKSKSNLFYLVCLAWLVACFFLLFNSSQGYAQDLQLTPTEQGMIPIVDMMATPVLPENPTQADYGTKIYYYVCMACHGDRGQGLTPEWVEAWQLDKNACWASKCHGGNHPPEGFRLPRNIPGVIGPVLTQRFRNGLELHDYIKTAMPWHAPGTLKDEEYWQLTAFLLRANGLWNSRTELNESNAAQVIIRADLLTATPAPTTDSKSRSGLYVLILAAICAFILVLLAAWVHQRSSHKLN